MSTSTSTKASNLPILFCASNPQRLEQVCKLWLVFVLVLRCWPLCFIWIVILHLLQQRSLCGELRNVVLPKL
jgi:hypothetical protein